MNKKFLKFSLVIGLMAGVVALYSCKKENKDEPTPDEPTSQELGIQAAHELCDCFSNAEDFMEEMNCMLGLMTKYDGMFRNPQTGEEGDPEFEDAFNNEFMGNCDPSNIPQWFIDMWTK
ncbi:MAG: hypothetical protein LBH22_00890 [Bacteroidales bacterium]|jgi:hypothetical protein|nr:hypothetical protein [Bacteroidales bacterium]